MVKGVGRGRWKRKAGRGKKKTVAKAAPRAAAKKKTAPVKAKKKTATAAKNGRRKAARQLTGAQQGTAATNPGSPLAALVRLGANERANVLVGHTIYPTKKIKVVTDSGTTYLVLNDGMVVVPAALAVVERFPVSQPVVRAAATPDTSFEESDETTGETAPISTSPSSPQSAAVASANAQSAESAPKGLTVEDEEDVVETGATFNEHEGYHADSPT